MRIQIIERADCAAAWHMEYDFVVAVELHEYKVFINKDDLIDE